MTSEYGMNTINAGESCLLMKPKFPSNPTKHGVMFVHGAGSASTYCIDSYGSQNVLTRKVVSAGFTALAGDIGGTTTWGNATAMARMTSAYNYLQSVPGVKPGKIALISGSMGGLTSFNWAAANPTLVSAIVTVIPVINPSDIVTNDRGGYAASVNSAYGGAWSQGTYGATYSPRTRATAGAFGTIPMLIFYGATDTLCMPAETLAFAASVGASATTVSIATGHAEATYSSVNHDQAVAFLNANA